MMPLLVDTLLAGGRRQVRAYCLRILLAAVAALVAAMAIAMFAGSAFLSLADSMSVPAAAAVTGGGLLAAAGLLALIAARGGRGRYRHPAPAAASGLAERLEAAAAAIGRHARSDTAGFAVTALVAGCAIGASPELRRAILDLLTPKA